MTEEQARALAYAATDARVTQSLMDEVRAGLDAELLRARVTLCDVLWGRVMRFKARQLLEDARIIESVGAPREAVTELVDSAAHAEWIATITERGQVIWGGRKNRDGMTAEEFDAERRSADVRAETTE